MGTKRIVGLAGRRGSGKGFALETLRNYFAKKAFTTSIFKASAVLGEVLNIAGIEKNQENYNQLTVALNSVKPLFLRDLLERAIEAALGVLIVDGVRQPGAAELIKEHGGVVYYIDADDAERYQKVLLRKEKEGDQNISYEEFIADEEALANKNISSIRQYADRIFYNRYDGDFKKELEKAIEEDFPFSLEMR